MSIQFVKPNKVGSLQEYNKAMGQKAQGKRVSQYMIDTLVKEINPQNLLISEVQES